MKTNNQIHHDEQMDAARAEFNRLWHGELLERMTFLRVRISDFPKYEDVAWRTFLKAKGIK